MKPNWQWKVLCLQLAGEPCSVKREAIVSEVRSLEAAEEHTRRVEFSKEARTSSQYAIEYSASAKAIGVEMQGTADDAAETLKGAQARQRARA